MQVGRGLTPPLPADQTPSLLLTGYMGGAIATHVRVGSPLLTHVLFPVYVTILFWGGLFLRDEPLRMVLRRPL